MVLLGSGGDPPSPKSRRRRKRLKRLLISVSVGLAGLMLAVVGAIASWMGGGGIGGGALAASSGDCLAGPPAAGGSGQPGSLLDGLQADQITNAQTIIAVGQGAKSWPNAQPPLPQVPDRGLVVALATASQESNLVNLDHGDRDSLGLFQQRPSQGWGTPADIMNPVYSATQFYQHLLQVDNWQTLPVTAAAQAVQHSAFPNAYAKWVPLAQALVERYAGVDLSTGCESVAQAPTQAVQTAIDFAKQQLGKPYVWGATGPNSFDCSGLMLRSWQAAGITLPRTSREQWHAGVYIPLLQAQAGDLLFWAYDTGDAGTIHHVAMYLGDGHLQDGALVGGHIIEAQQTGVPVHIRPVTFTEDEEMAYAVRVWANS